MKQCFLNRVDNEKNAITKEKRYFLSQLNAMMSNSQHTGEQIMQIKETYYSLYVSAFDIKLTETERIEFIHGMLQEVIKIVIASNLPNDEIFSLMDKLDVINSLTFLLDQIRENKFSKKLIEKYLMLAKGTDFYATNVIQLFRINKSFVKENYCLDISRMNSKELYLGITSGYFDYSEYNSESYIKLVSLCIKYAENNDGGKRKYLNPLFVVNELHKDGFITDLNHFAELVGVDASKIVAVDTICRG